MCKLFKALENLYCNNSLTNSSVTHVFDPDKIKLESGIYSHSRYFSNIYPTEYDPYRINFELLSRMSASIGVVDSSHCMSSEEVSNALISLDHESMFLVDSEESFDHEPIRVSNTRVDITPYGLYCIAIRKHFGNQLFKDTVERMLKSQSKRVNIKLKDTEFSVSVLVFEDDLQELRRFARSPISKKSVECLLRHEGVFCWRDVKVPKG